MANEYYTPSGTPADNSTVTSNPIRSEYNLIEAGAQKLPLLSTYNNRLTTVNSAASALESPTPATAISRLAALGTSLKDYYDGYVGLTLLKLVTKNVLNTISSFFTNSNTAARTYTFPDKNGEIQLTNNVAPHGMKNAIINGNFDIWQRGTTQSTAGILTADRWNFQKFGGTASVTRETFALGQTDVPHNPRYFHRTVISLSGGSAGYTEMRYRIERSSTFSGQPVTLSFYAKADSPKNIAVEFQQNFGTGGVPSAGVSGIGKELIPITASWQRVEVSFDMPSIAGKTLGTNYSAETQGFNGDDYLQFRIFYNRGDADTTELERASNIGNQTGTFDIAQVQLERGGSSSPFEYRTIGEELRLCQRYYITAYIHFSGNVTSTATYRMIAQLPVSMMHDDEDGKTVTDLTVTNFPGTYVITVESHWVYMTRVANGTGAGEVHCKITMENEL